MSTKDNTPASLLEVLELDGLQPEEQEELLLELNELVFKGTLMRLLERMDEATRTDFDELMSGEPSEDQVMAFLQERVPDADQAVEETVQELRDDILAVAG